MRNPFKKKRPPLMWFLPSDLWGTVPEKSTPQTPLEKCLDKSLSKSYKKIRGLESHFEVPQDESLPNPDIQVRSLIGKPAWKLCAGDWGTLVALEGRKWHERMDYEEETVWVRFDLNSSGERVCYIRLDPGEFEVM